MTVPRRISPEKANTAANAIGYFLAFDRLPPSNYRKRLSQASYGQRNFCEPPMNNCSLRYLAVMASAILSTAPATAAPDNERPRYSIIDLGRSSEVVALNDKGEVAGTRTTSDGHRHAFLYSQGHIIDLGTLGGADSFAQGLNSSGVVVGLAQTAEKMPGPGHRQLFKPFIFSNGTLRELQLIAPATETIDRAVDINDSGQIAVTLHSQIGAIWSSGSAELLGTLVPAGTGVRMGESVKGDGTRTPIISYRAGYVVPRRINRFGTVIGLAKAMDSSEHAFIYSHKQLTDLGILDGKSSQAKDLNDDGTVVGSYRTNGGAIHAVRFISGKPEDLGIPAGFENSSAEGINNTGEIVGQGYTITGGSFLRIDAIQRGFRWDKGRWIDLTKEVDFGGSGSTVIYGVTRINNGGDIIGQAGGAAGGRSGCLLQRQPN